MLNEEQCWAAVIAHDATQDGRFFYSVRTTGVYCRPCCAARLARRENVRFHATAAEDEKRLLSLPEGQAAWSDNQRESEQQYEKALALDATNFKAYRGLGLLYEKAGRNQDAVAAYRKLRGK